MRKNFFKGAALAALSLVGFTAIAQEEEAKESVVGGIELSGSVDAYFRANLNGRNGANAVNPTTSFVDNDGFSVGMINLIASKQVGKVGFVADLGFGPRASNAILGEDTADVVNQLFVTYAASDLVTFTLGRFNTFLGYEVISPTGNFNYSTSYLFTNGPFSHSGLKADFSLDDNWSLTAAIMNSTTSGVEGNENGKYTGGLQVGYSADAGSGYLNFLYGRNEQDIEETLQVDFTGGLDITEEFYLGLNASYLTTKDAGTDENGDVDDQGFYGVALYPQYAISEAFSLGLRGEYFAEFGNRNTAIGSAFDDSEATVFAVTLTGSYNVGNLTIKPEFRLDSADEDQANFAKFDNGAIEAQKSLASFVLGAIYSF